MIHKPHSRRIIATSIIATSASLALAACSSGATSSASNPSGSSQKRAVTLTIGNFPAISPIALLQANHTLTKEGYNVKWTTILSGLPTEASAMASGSLDFAWGNTAAAIPIFAKAPNVAWLVGECITNENLTVVSKKSGITKASQLAHKKVAVTGLKTASTLFYELALAKAGVKPSTDSFVTTNGPAMVGIMSSGAAPVSATFVPYGTEMVVKGLGRVLVTADQAYGQTAPGDGLMVSQAFAKAHPKAVVAVLKAFNQADAEIKNDPQKSDPILASFAKVPQQVIAYSIEKGYIGVSTSVTPKLSDYEKLASVEQQYGFAPGNTNLSSFAAKFVHPSFAEQAAG